MIGHESRSIQWKSARRIPRWQSSWGQYGAHLAPVGPTWAPCWSHEHCYQGVNHPCNALYCDDKMSHIMWQCLVCRLYVRQWTQVTMSHYVANTCVVRWYTVKWAIRIKRKYLTNILLNFNIYTYILKRTCGIILVLDANTLLIWEDMQQCIYHFLLWSLNCTGSCSLDVICPPVGISNGWFILL